jgi:hypothetical protein
MKFKDLQIGDKFCYYGGVCYFVKISGRGYKTENDDFIFQALPEEKVEKVGEQNAHR